MSPYFWLSILILVGASLPVLAFLFYKGLFYEFNKRYEQRRKEHAEWCKARGITQRSDN